MSKLKAGIKAPDFSITNQHGDLVSLKQFIGKKVVLFFYPQDNTPTCTEEACNLRDHFKVLSNQGFVVLGISPDKEKKHQNFIAKHQLPYDLLCDPEKIVHQLYGTWGEKQMFGRKYMGTLRTTFIINEKGIISHIIEKVEAKRHANQILDLVK